MYNMNHDYPPEWDEDEEAEEVEADADIPDDDDDYDPKYAFEHMTDLEIRYNRG